MHETESCAYCDFFSLVGESYCRGEPMVGRVFFVLFFVSSTDSAKLWGRGRRVADISQIPACLYFTKAS